MVLSLVIPLGFSSGAKIGVSQYLEWLWNSSFPNNAPFFQYVLAEIAILKYTIFLEDIKKICSQDIRTSMIMLLADSFQFFILINLHPATGFIDAVLLFILKVFSQNN